MVACRDRSHSGWETACCCFRAHQAANGGVSFSTSLQDTNGGPHFTVGGFKGQRQEEGGVYWHWQGWTYWLLFENNLLTHYTNYMLISNTHIVILKCLIYSLKCQSFVTIMSSGKSQEVMMRVFRHDWLKPQILFCLVSAVNELKFHNQHYFYLSLLERAGTHKSD